MYLDAYRTQLPLDLTHIDYYRVVQNLVFLYDSEIMQALRIPIINQRDDRIYSQSHQN